MNVTDPMASGASCHWGHSPNGDLSPSPGFSPLSSPWLTMHLRVHSLAFLLVTSTFRPPLVPRSLSKHLVCLTPSRVSDGARLPHSRVS